MEQVAHIPDFDFSEILRHLPRDKQVELERGLQIIFEEFEEGTQGIKTVDGKRPRIIKVILFGSFARDSWVEDHTSGYRSDYDLLIVVNDGTLDEKADLWMVAEDRLIDDKHISREMNFIVHSLQDINQQLAEGRYFFCDIVRDGITLHEIRAAGQLGEPRTLDAAEARQQAEEYFRFGKERISYFLNHHRTDVKNNDLSMSAFQLHQAVEKMYSTYLLVHTLYTPPSHNIKFLRSLCNSMEPSLHDIWPRTGKRRKDTAAFSLLKRAYVEARYSLQYKITREQLDWLLERTLMLQDRIYTACEKKLAE